MADSTLPKGIGTITGKDFWKGAIVTIFGHIVTIIIFLIRQDHWPLWVEWQPYVEITVYTFLVYLGKNLGTNNVGELFKADKEVMQVSKGTLDDLKEKAEK